MLRDKRNKVEAKMTVGKIAKSMGLFKNRDVPSNVIETAILTAIKKSIRKGGKGTMIMAKMPNIATAKIMSLRLPFMEFISLAKRFFSEARTLFGKNSRSHYYYPFL